MRFALLLLAIASLGWCEGEAERGRELFRSCQACHDTTTGERKMGPSLRSLFGKVTLRNGKHSDDANVREIILDGLNGMPSFRYSFRAAEIDDLMAYLHTLKGKPAAEPLVSGEAYFKAYCLRCHNAESRTAPGPDLQGRYTPESWTRIEEGHAGAPAMKKWLDEAGRKLLAGYLARFAPQ